MLNSFHFTGLFQHPPENIKKTGFLMSSGGTKRERGMKWVNKRMLPLAGLTSQRYTKELFPKGVSEPSQTSKKAVTQPAFTCSKSIIETPERCVKSVQS